MRYFRGYPLHFGGDLSDFAAHLHAFCQGKRFNGRKLDLAL